MYTEHRDSQTSLVHGFPEPYQASLHSLGHSLKKKKKSHLREIQVAQEVGPEDIELRVPGICPTITIYKVKTKVEKISQKEEGKMEMV